MPYILVSPLSAVDTAIAAHRPSHMVTLLSPKHMIETPSGFPVARHLRLDFNDVADIAAGTHPPSREHIDALLHFLRDWDGRAPYLIHCWASVRRSMASAYTLLCDRMSPWREIEIARAMRRRAPHAAPNRLLVAHANSILGRDGRMIAALNTMGPARMVEEGVTTELPLTDL